MTINEVTAELHAETVNARRDAILAKMDMSKVPANMQAAALASRAAVEAVAESLISDPMQIVEGTTAVLANPAIFARMMSEAAREAGRAAMSK